MYTHLRCINLTFHHQAHPKCDHLLDTDVCARGVFQPEVTDPEYCNAEATNLWELSLLRVHYDDQLNPVTTNIALGAPSQGANALSHKFINRFVTIWMSMIKFFNLNLSSNQSNFCPGPKMVEW